ncbi:hypothetical protein LXL04_025077 [Taraxacum kok-saghyz]
MEAVSNHNPQFHIPIPFNNKTGYTKGNCTVAMEKLKEALIQFADSNPSLFPHDGFNSYTSLIEQRFSQSFFDFQTPNHPPYAAMIHKAIGDLNEKRGSSEESISKYIKQEFLDLPWAHSTLLKHHLEKLCDRKEISITHKQRYFLPVTDSDPLSISKSEKQLKRKRNSETEKKGSMHNKKRKKSKKKELVLQETNKQITEVFQEQEQEQDQDLPLLDDEQQNVIIHNEMNAQECLQIDYQTYEEGNNLTDVCIQMEEGGVCGNENDQIETQGKKKRKLKMKSKKRGKIGKKNEKTQLQDSSEANLKQKNEGERVWTKSQIKKMSNMPKEASSEVCTRKNGQRLKLRSFKKKKGVLKDKCQKKQKTHGKHKMTRRSSKKRKAPNPLD